ncbi:serine/threonine-protein kinase STY46 [Dendrobium catenatum]|uniref:Serine/threonine-protein kinase HT1 n=1 Tax=Dendrobium catenatum TaxID=906689 RepID=A0A2I0WBI3_9ASPA|nr:serine/threonine-protein kinase STY46 [Dendrobium catenatum]PKU73017.1 Serine/threonine-protein kinase HT1 [Dendrobium catenatum]
MAALECSSGGQNTGEKLFSHLLMRARHQSEAFGRELPEKKWQRMSRNVVAAIAALRNSLNLNVSNSSLTHLFPGSHIPEKLLSDIRRHFDSLPNSYSQAGFDIKEVCLHLGLVRQAADDGQPAFQIQRISGQDNVFKIVFVCKSAFSWPTMSGAIGGSVVCFKKTQIFEKKELTLGVVTVLIDARCEKNFKYRIEAALRSAAKKQRNAGVKLHFRLCGCQEEGLVTNEKNSVFSAPSEINACPIRQIHLPNPLPEIICSGGAELSRWLLRAEDIKFIERAGINSFIGTYKGKKVWIKKLKRCERGSAYEIEIQQKLIGLMSCGHKNLLQFCGVCFNESNDGLCVVTRLMEGGSVHDLIQKKKVRVGDIMRIGLDVSEGLLFMNNHGMAYRDLNRQRILLDEEGRACLGDMGIVSTCMNRRQATEYETAGYQWLAPEIIAADPENKTETWMSNVYSFGMLLWEMVTGEVAYSSYSPVQAAVGIAAYGMRPEIPKDCPPILRSLMIRCWNNFPSKRPQLSEIVAILSKQKISVG